MQLVVLVRTREMHARAANVRNGGHSALADIVLNVDMPLLHVWPDRFVGQRHELQGSRGGSRGAKKTGIQTVIPGGSAATGGREWGWNASDGRAFALMLQRFGFGFVAVGMFVEHSEAAAY